jgi:hypothetical protein
MNMHSDFGDVQSAVDCTIYIAPPVKVISWRCGLWNSIELRIAGSSLDRSYLDFLLRYKIICQLGYATPPITKDGRVRVKNRDNVLPTIQQQQQLIKIC